MTDIEYIMERIKAMEIEMWAKYYRPKSCGYVRPETGYGLFDPRDRNSKSWNGSHRYMQPQPPIRNIRQ